MAVLEHANTPGLPAWPGGPGSPAPGGPGHIMKQSYCERINRTDYHI